MLADVSNCRERTDAPDTISTFPGTLIDQVFALARGKTQFNVCCAADELTGTTIFKLNRRTPVPSIKTNAVGGASELGALFCSDEIVATVDGGDSIAGEPSSKAFISPAFWNVNGMAWIPDLRTSMVSSPEIKARPVSI